MHKRQSVPLQGNVAGLPARPADVPLAVVLPAVNGAASTDPSGRIVAMSRIGKHACGEGSQERIVARRARAHSRAPRLPAARSAAWCRRTEGPTASPLPPATLPAPVFDAINGRDSRMVEEGQHLGLAARIAPCDPDRLQKLAAIL